MISPLTSPAMPRPSDPLRDKAAQLESAFLSQMLGQAGLGATSGAFGGGAGEAQFASFLRDEQARAMVDHGGIGLTESLYRAMGGKE